MDSAAAAVVPFKDYERTVFKLMDRLEVAALLAEQGLILLKPNLVTSSPPPVTTEAAMVAAHHKLDNLTLIIDRNHLQQGTRTSETTASSSNLKQRLSYRSKSMIGSFLSETC